jgi:DNA polymerase-3 subunit alpha
MEIRFDYELSMIERTGFVDDFLIVWDFVNWAKQNGVIGCLLGYLPKITGIDPIRLGLLFETFLNLIGCHHLILTSIFA